MTGKDLFQGIGMIKEEYVVEAEQYKRSVIHNTVFRRSIAMTACLVVCLGLYWGVVQKPAYKSARDESITETEYTMEKETAFQEVAMDGAAPADLEVAEEAISVEESVRTTSVECLPAVRTSETVPSVTSATPESNNRYDEEKEELSGSQKIETTLTETQDAARVCEVAYGKVKTGQKLWEDFLQTVRLGEACSISLVQYTTEGVTIYTQVVYDTKTFHVEVDNAQDKSAADAGIQEYEFNYLYIVQEDGEYEAILATEAGLTEEQLYSGEYETLGLFLY